MNAPSDVIVIGAGVIGSAIAYFATKQGLSVTVLERGLPAGGASSSCEGNILVSDKELGPELELTKFSLDTWRGDLAEHAKNWEFESKGGIIVASRESSMASLDRLTNAQMEHGIDVEWVDIPRLRELEPNISPHALGAAWYPDDCQVQPMLVAGHLLKLARASGAKVVTHTPVTGFLRQGDTVNGVKTSGGDFHAPAVVNAAGSWSEDIAALAGVNVPVKPRKGFVMVTEPLPPMVHHKVYAAEYVDNVGSSDARLQSSPVVEGTPSGSILIGSSRERVGFDRSVNTDALRQMALNAIALFPFLKTTRIIRHYHGFRPYCPDHLPVIGHDSRSPGLWHASGYEGAGIGLSAGTGKLVAQALAGLAPDMSLAPFAPERFGEFAPAPRIHQESAA